MVVISVIMFALLIPMVMQAFQPPPPNVEEPFHSWAQGLAVFSVLAMCIVGTVMIDQLFACFQRGEIYEKATLRRFRVLSWLILLTGLAHWNLKVSANGVSFNPSSFLPGQFWVGLLLVFVSWILEIGTEIHDENRGTI